MKHEALSVENTIFDITQQIEQADPSMMLRELFDNAKFAAAIASSGIVRFLKFDPAILGLQGYNENKFAIYNNGTGLSPTNLVKITNLSSSLKTQSLKGNYGKGAKMASLGSNKKGMIYISCLNEQAHYLILGQIDETPQGDPIYGRFDLSGSGHVVSDCTDEVKSAGFNVNEEWTMVILCGNEFTQDTINQPYAVGKKIASAWAINDIYTRFFRIPKNVDVTFEIGHSKGSSQTPKFMPVSEYLFHAEAKDNNKIKCEWVVLTDPRAQGIKILYVWDGPWGGEDSVNSVKPTSTIGNPATRSAFSGIIYKDETYSVTDANAWRETAVHLGIPAGAKYLRIFVELPDNFICQPDLYRKELEIIRHEDEKTPRKESLSLRNFSELVYNNMPTWFSEKCKEYDTAHKAGSDIIKRLTDLLNTRQLKQTQQQSYQVTTKQQGIGSNIPGTAGKKQGNGKGGGGGGGGGGSISVNNGGPNPGSTWMRVITTKFKNVQVTKNVPEIRYIRTPIDLDTYNLTKTFEYRAGQFVRSPGKEEIYINCMSIQYKDIHNWINDKLKAEVRDSNILLEDKVRELSENELAWKVGSAVVRALAQEGREGWSTTDVDKILTAENLTLAADGWDDDQSDITTEIKKLALKLKLESKSDSSVNEEFDPKEELAN